MFLGPRHDLFCGKADDLIFKHLLFFSKSKIHNALDLKAPGFSILRGLAMAVVVCDKFSSG